MIRKASIALLTLGLTGAAALADNERVYYYDRQPDVTVHRYSDVDHDGRFERRTSYYLDNTGQIRYDDSPGDRVYYGEGAFSAYDVHVDRDSDVRRNAVVEPQRETTTIYANPADRPVVVEQQRVVERRPFYTGDNLQFRGELVGLNRVWSSALNNYTDIATIRQGDGRLVDFHVNNWRDLELKNFKLGDVVTIRADAHNANGRNYLVFEEINRR